MTDQFGVRTTYSVGKRVFYATRAQHDPTRVTRRRVYKLLV